MTTTNLNDMNLATRSVQILRSPPPLRLCTRSGTQSRAAHCRIRHTNVGPVLTAEFGRFSFLYLPFYPRTLAEKSKARAPVKIRQLGYELNARHARGKTLAIGWAEGKTPRLLMFRRGRWIQELAGIFSDFWSKAR
jgi:hypothetical protein